MLNSYRSDKNYLTKCYGYHILAFLILDAVLIYFWQPTWMLVAGFLPGLVLLTRSSFLMVVGSQVCCLVALVILKRPGIEVWHPALILLSGYLAIVASSLLHNASHRNIKPAWFCRTVGELCAVFQLVGFPDWTVVHMIHHRYPDDPERDPHPPLDLPFWDFLMGMRKSIGAVLWSDYSKRFGQTDQTRASWVRLGRAMQVNQIVKVAFWFLLLGPYVFTFLYVPSLVIKNLFYAHFNYRTHVHNGEENDIVNVDHNIGYNLLNLISFGLYYHLNHHDAPYLFNPKRGMIKKTG